MQKIPVFIIFLFLFASCKKNGGPCNCGLNGADSTSIVGKWSLKATRSWSIVLPNEPWTPVDPSHQAVVEFTADSLFKFDDNFPWKDSQYDRFKVASSGYAVDSVLYSSATYPPNDWRPAMVSKINAKEILLSQLGVDTDEQEQC